MPVKYGETHPIYDYEVLIFDALLANKLLLVLKATGLGITELFLRIMGWFCLKDDRYQGWEMPIVVGPNLDLAINMVSERLKPMFSPFFNFNTDKTVMYLNGVKIKAYPSHHVDAFRSLPKVAFIYISEGDFFTPGQQRAIRDVAERYIGKSNPYIAWESTPNLPEGLFFQIEQEEKSIYRRMRFEYTWGEGKIYTKEDLEKAKESPSFPREYNLRYGYGVGNIFPYKLLEPCTYKYDLSMKNGQKVLAVDPGFGSSQFAIVGAELLDGIIYIKESQQYERASPSDMVELVVELYTQGGYEICLVDSSQPGIIKDLLEGSTDGKRIGINVKDIIFREQLSHMVVGASTLVKERGVAIHPVFEDLLYQLKAVTSNWKGHPDKRKLTFDLGDSFLMAVSYFSTEEVKTADLGK